MNHEYFEKWTPEMAYYLGWLWADGNICDGKLQIGCVTEDEEIILNFMQAIGSNHKIIRKPGYQHKKGYYVKPYTKASIYSEKLISCLVNVHGILPRKTYNDLPFPELNESYLIPFIRGYFDGDGSIFKRENGTIGISMIGTKQFMTKMQSAICKATGLPGHTITKCKNTKTITAAWTVNWNKKSEVLTFLNFIYDGLPYLNRKKELADLWLPELIEYCKWCGVENKNDRIRLRFMSKRLGEYKNVEECLWARNYAHFKTEGYQFPIASPIIEPARQSEIINLIDKRLIGDKTHQRKLNKQIQNDKEKTI